MTMVLVADDEFLFEKNIFAIVKYQFAPFTIKSTSFAVM